RPGGGARRVHPNGVACDLAHECGGHLRLACVLDADEQDGRLLLDHDVYLCSVDVKSHQELADTGRDVIAAEQPLHAGGSSSLRFHRAALMSTTHQQGRASRVSTMRLRTRARWLPVLAGVAPLGARGWTRRKRRG